MTSIREFDDKSNILSIKIKLQQGSVLSIYIFTLVIDKVINDI
jgi:D-Tyr-tRNAtyr deacylase